MRNLFALLLLAVLVPVLAGCDSDDPMDGPNGQACDNGTMTATVDGQAFTAECTQIIISNGTVTLAGIANFDGSAGPNQQQINIGGAQAATGPQTPITATYADLDLNNPTAAQTCAASPIPGAGSISLNIAAIDDTSASGTFSFNALCPSTGATVTVASGQFDISK